jgi:hypothetical protein
MRHAFQNGFVTFFTKNAIVGVLPPCANACGATVANPPAAVDASDAIRKVLRSMVRLLLSWLTQVTVAR